MQKALPVEAPFLLRLTAVEGSYAENPETVRLYRVAPAWLTRRNDALHEYRTRYQA
jgi:hypothetical protein